MNELDSLVKAAGNREYFDSAVIDFPDIVDTEELIAYYKLQRKGYKYARDFFTLLSVSDEIMPELLPIVFRDELGGIAYANDNDTGYSRGAFGCGNGYTSLQKQAVIFIDLPRRKKPVLSQSLKQYIRHEVIHYYLWVNDLPFEDNTALFWAFCNIYDGNAYAVMPEEENNKYNKFIEKCKEYQNVGVTALKMLAKAVILNDEEEMRRFINRLEFQSKIAAVK